LHLCGDFAAADQSAQDAIGRLSLSAAPVRRHLGFLSLVGEDGMTSRNALLRSGKGLGIPGTARKEDKKTKLKVAAPAPEEDRQGHFALRKGVRCAGVHLIVDLHGAERLDDLEHIESDAAPLRRRRARHAACTSTFIISSRTAYPAWRCWRKATSRSILGPTPVYAALDVFMCGSADPDACIPVLREAFSAKRVGVNEILRGLGA
jgi:S-adenosylmethionine decarboxylase